MAHSTKSVSEAQNNDSPDEGERPIVIKKYANRRLYNTATSSYIVLGDVVDLIKGDTAFRIEDAKSGEDITRSILNQVIFEQETEGSGYHFPLEFQKKLISMYGNNYGSMIPDYLTQSIKLFAQEREKMSDAFESMVGRNTDAMMNYSEALAKQNLELFKNSWNMIGALTGLSDQKKEPSDKSEEMSDQDSELSDIQAKIDALQERLKNLK